MKLKQFNSSILTLILLFSFGAHRADAQQVSPQTSTQNTNITQSEVEAAQKAWGAALIQISQDYKNDGLKKATATAKKVLDNAYGYTTGPVLFKPTLTSGDQTFRTTYDGALSYFVGGNKKYPLDSGFALKDWTKYDYKNAMVFINGDLAITMGNVFLINSDGQLTKVDKTWGFKKFDDGKIRIVLHHSSLPYQH